MTRETWVMSHEGPFKVAMDLSQVEDPILTILCGNCGEIFVERPIDGVHERRA